MFGQYQGGEGQRPRGRNPLQKGELWGIMNDKAFLCKTRVAPESWGSITQEQIKPSSFLRMQWQMIVLDAGRQMRSLEI